MHVHFRSSFTNNTAPYRFMHPAPADLPSARAHWLATRKQTKQMARHELGDPHAFDAYKKSDRAVILAKWLVHTYGHQQLNSGSGVSAEPHCTRYFVQAGIRRQVALTRWLSIYGSLSLLLFKAGGCETALVWGGRQQARIANTPPMYRHIQAGNSTIQPRDCASPCEGAGIITSSLHCCKSLRMRAPLLH